jgi:GNAT superfamily N-acetyltransferase
MNDRTVRIATPDDAEAIGSLLYRSHTIAYAEFMDQQWVETLNTLESYLAVWRSYFTHPPTAAQTSVVCSREQVLSSATVGPLDEQDRCAHPSHLSEEALWQVACLHAIHVDPDHIRLGIGRLLMQVVLQFFRANGYIMATLLTHETNLRARRFYEATGWWLDGSVEKPPRMPKGVRYHIDLNDHTSNCTL